MVKKLLALCVVGTLVLGSAAMASPPGGGGVNCSEFCAETVTLPDGTFCVLDGCLAGGGTVYCNYSCFWGLPVGPFPRF
jgi:hypothetical protein